MYYIGENNVFASVFQHEASLCLRHVYYIAWTRLNFFHLLPMPPEDPSTAVYTVRLFKMHAYITSIHITKETRLKHIQAEKYMGICAGMFLFLLTHRALRKQEKQKDPWRPPSSNSHQPSKSPAVAGEREHR